MVDELSQGLRSIGQEIIMISPYYNQNRKGQTDYLHNDPFNIHHIRNVSINLDANYCFGVHHGVGNDGIKYYFLHNARLFPRPYPDFGPADTIREIACFAKASLQLLCDLGTIPAIVLTNDWFTGLVAAYARNGSFGDTFKGTTFMHICHNLEPTYEGRLYPSPGEGTLQGIYQFDPNWLIDPCWKTRVINPSRCALMISDKWATVSNSYKKDLQSFSPLAHILNSKPYPFSYPNGIFKEKRLKQLKEKAGGDRKACKKYIQQKYFGYGDADYSVPVYSFVGRLTQQKGILLILDSVEELIRRTGGKINILVGGMGNPRDPYVGACFAKIHYLRGKYPYAFWANPTEFFTDGPKINMGSDFGLMPSLFEPGGIVQHEFFIAGTPVIAYRTGGLKDTVFEFRWDNNSGNGCTFDNYNCGDFINAIHRSLGIFQNQEKLEICRKNCEKSAIDVSDVSRAWCKEFYLIKHKLFVNLKEVQSAVLDQNDRISSESFKTPTYLGNSSNNASDTYLYSNVNTPNISQMSLTSNQKGGSQYNLNSIVPNNSYVGNSKLQRQASGLSGLGEQINASGETLISFSFGEEGYQPKVVQITGSYDGWKNKTNLKYDPIKNKWECQLKLKSGKYYYKYVADGNWKTNPKEQKEKDNDGNENNVIVIH